MHGADCGQKRDPQSTKRLCIITLTRIFLLTHGHPSLTREITTPSLPGFITSCLNAARTPALGPDIKIPGPKNHLRLVVLQALNELIILHPTLFRPLSAQIRGLVFPLLAPTSSEGILQPQNHPASGPLSEIARRLYVSLAICAPKNTSAEEWAKSLRNTLISTHNTADRIFRAVNEDWSPPSRDHIAIRQTMPANEEISDQNPEPMILPAWKGIDAGIERLDGLLHTAQTFLANQTPATVTLPVGDIMNLADRILSVLAPTNHAGVRTRPEIGRDEREGLFVGLPQLHISVMGLLSLLISRLGSNAAPVSKHIFEQILWVLESDHTISDVRKTGYKLVSQILLLFGRSFPKSCAPSLSRLIKLCCEDLVPPDEILQSGTEASGPGIKNGSKSGAFLNGDSYLKSNPRHTGASQAPKDVQDSALAMLPVILTHIPQGFISLSLRYQIDRTAILSKNKGAMLAVAMKPRKTQKGGKATSSIMPLLARGFPAAIEVEALVRPQMPAIPSADRDALDVISEEEEEVESHDDHFEKPAEPREGDALQISNVAGETEQMTPTNKPVEKSATGLLDATSEASIISNKRIREESPSTNFQLGVSSTATPGSHESADVGPRAKQPRLTQMGSKLETEEWIDENAAEVVPGLVPAEQTAKVSSDLTMRNTGGQFDIEQEGSEESEFEIPTLNMGSSSDEEDEDDS